MWGISCAAISARSVRDIQVMTISTAQTIAARDDVESALAVTVDCHTLLQKLVVQSIGLEYVDYAQPNSTAQFMK
jgi:hypothetical protein